MLMQSRGEPELDVSDAGWWQNTVKTKDGTIHFNYRLSKDGKRLYALGAFAGVYDFYPWQQFSILLQQTSAGHWDVPICVASNDKGSRSVKDYPLETVLAKVVMKRYVEDMKDVSAQVGGSSPHRDSGESRKTSRRRTKTPRPTPAKAGAAR